MKKIFVITLLLLSLSSCNSSSKINDNSGYLNGVEDFKRTHCFKYFTSDDEMLDFLTQLKAKGQNGDFHLGHSHFDLTPDYECFIEFDGHISIDSSSELDILDTTYDSMIIHYKYRYKDASILPPSKHLIYLNFHSFYLSPEETFENAKIEWVVEDSKAFEGDKTIWKIIRFKFYIDDKLILIVFIQGREYMKISEEEMIQQLVSNYSLFV